MSINKNLYSKSFIRNFAINYEIEEKSKFIQSQDKYYLSNLENFSKDIETSRA